MTAFLFRNRLAASAVIALIFLTARANAQLTELTEPTQTRDEAGTVTLAESDASAIIRYTLDGTTPIRTSGAYLAPIELPAGGVVKAKAFAADRKQSSPLSEKQWPALPGVAAIPSTLVEVTQDRNAPGYIWATRHAAALAAMKQRQPEVIFVGDSIIHHWGGEPVDYNQFGKDIWAREYEKYHAVDLGFGWDRTENVLWRLDHGELDGASPKVAVVMIGTNNLHINSTPEIAAGVTAICDKLHAKQPKMKILLLAIFPRSQRPDGMRTQVNEVNALLENLDGKNDITYLDISSVFLNPDQTISKQIMSDYLHPTAEGYDRWAKAMNPTLEKLLQADR